MFIQKTRKMHKRLLKPKEKLAESQYAIWYYWMEKQGKQTGIEPTIDFAWPACRVTIPASVLYKNRLITSKQIKNGVSGLTIYFSSDLRGHGLTAFNP